MQKNIERGQQYSMKTTSIIQNTDGVIIDFHSERSFGVILLKQKTIGNFLDHIRKYIRSKNKNKFWLARFDLNDLSEKTRQDIMKLLEKEHNMGSKMTLNKFLKGKLVVCDVVKDTHWKVQCLSIDLHQTNLPISIKMTSRSSQLQSVTGSQYNQSERRFSKRMEIKNLRKGSNISHPYRG